jgi:hypothetical protein
MLGLEVTGSFVLNARMSMKISAASAPAPFKVEVDAAGGY